MKARKRPPMQGIKCTWGEFAFGFAVVCLALWFSWMTLEPIPDRNARLLQVHKEMQFGNK